MLLVVLISNLFKGFLVELEEEIADGNAYNGGSTGGGLTRDQVLAGWDDDDDSTESTFELLLDNTMDDVDSQDILENTLGCESEDDMYEREITSLDLDYEEFADSKYLL